MTYNYTKEDRALLQAASHSAQPLMLALVGRYGELITISEDIEEDEHFGLLDADLQAKVYQAVREYQLMEQED